MSRFVYNLRFISSKAQKAALVNYIATREGVEKVTLSDEASVRPATVKQQEVLQELIKEYPGSKGLLEYEDYLQNPNMRSASSLISAIMDNNADSFFSPEKYLGYISQRPGVEKAGTHGLFSSEKNINLQQVIDEVSNTKGNLYTGVLSLRREDAHALCYENAAAWKAVIEKNLPKIAEAYKIPLNDLKWYAAFHNESHHPHCHMLVYSTGKEGYINRTGIENIKSAIATDLFRDELSCIYHLQRQSIDKTYAAASDILKDMPMSESGKEIIQNKLLELSDKLQNYTGKKVYGYLPKKMKALVNSVASELAKEPAIQEAYNQFLDAREKQLLIYHSKDTLPPREDILENKKFKKIKNLIIKEAAALQRSIDISIPATVPVADEPNYIDYVNFEPFTENEQPFVYGENFDFSPAAEPPNSAAAETSAESLDTSDEINKILIERIESDSFFLSLFSSREESNLYYDIKKLIYNVKTAPDRELALRQLLNMAIKGNAYAVYDIAAFCASGKLLEKNELFSQCAYKKVLDTFLDNLKTDDEKLKNYLSYRVGKMYYYGLGTDKELSKAVEHLEPPADAGNKYANFTLGRIYESENEIGIDIPKAVEYYTKSAENGQPYAAYRLARLYEQGAEGLKSSPEMAEKYYKSAYTGFLKLAKDTPDEHLFYHIGNMALYGKGCEVNFDVAEKYLKAACDDFGYYAAAYKLAQIYSNPESGSYDISKAIDYYKLSWEKEQNPYAIYQLGKLYYFGTSGLEPDKELGKYYLQLATDNGVEQANNILNHHAANSNQSILAAVSLFKNALRMFGVGNHNEGHTPKFKLTKADYLEKLKRGEKMSYDTN